MLLRVTAHTSARADTDALFSATSSLPTELSRKKNTELKETRLVPIITHLYCQRYAINMAALSTSVGKLRSRTATDPFSTAPTIKSGTEEATKIVKNRIRFGCILEF